MSDTLEALRAIVAEDHAVPPERLTPDATLEDLGIDSLGTIEMLWRVEERFGVEVPSEPPALSTLGDVARYVDELVAAREGTTGGGTAGEGAARAAPDAPGAAAGPPPPDDPPA